MNKEIHHRKSRETFHPRINVYRTFVTLQYTSAFFFRNFKNSCLQILSSLYHVTTICHKKCHFIAYNILKSQIGGKCPDFWTPSGRYDT